MVLINEATIPMPTYLKYLKQLTRRESIRIVSVDQTFYACAQSALGSLDLKQSVGAGRIAPRVGSTFSSRNFTGALGFVGWRPGDPGVAT